MGGATCPALAAAVSNAGALGMLALSFSSPEDIRNEIRRTRELTSKPFGVNLLLPWPQQERLQVCLEEGAKIVSFFWGDPATYIPLVHDAGGVVLLTVGDPDEARRAVDAGVDVIVAQGVEAGGHVRGVVGTLPLVPLVVDEVDPIPVVAAGGIADGRGLAAVLALGAAGAWMGTRFLASQEALVNARYRELLLQAGATDTVYTSLFDVGWPPPDAPHRVLRNKTIDAWESAGHPASGQRPGEGEAVAKSDLWGPIARYTIATASSHVEGDIDALALYAGQGVGLVRRTQSAAEIVKEIVEGAHQAIERAGRES
jgi:NAD(P)H-dependent flavin oxidoreductase YrpB (nitropropane dioxygenase family)